ncbi:MAG: radical SAM protein [Acidobacteria bacterium]|nr:radical SAM protein [Acidobacteriota bacterium]
MQGVVAAWGRILRGYRPNLSIEITRECPLRCPGCYAYGDTHLGGRQTLRELSDLKGDALVDGVLALVKRHKPLHVSLVGGEPLVRYRELGVLLPRLAAAGIHTQLVTSAVRPIPREWAGLRRLQIVVSIDGLPPEHDARRAPATYDRIRKHIAGHQVTVHCTVTRQQARREGYLEEFIALWSDNPDTRQIWVSFYTPQVGEVSDERLTDEDRRRLVAELKVLRRRYPRLGMPGPMIEALGSPPESPGDCIFARTTTCVSADLRQPITPCQFGGTPECTACGCAASAGLAAVGRHRLPGGLEVGRVFDLSFAIGERVRRWREGEVPVAPRREPASTPSLEPHG